MHIFTGYELVYLPLTNMGIGTFPQHRELYGIAYGELCAIGQEEHRAMYIPSLTNELVYSTSYCCTLHRAQTSTSLARNIHPFETQLYMLCPTHLSHFYPCASFPLLVKVQQTEVGLASIPCAVGADQSIHPSIGSKYNDFSVEDCVADTSDGYPLYSVVEEIHTTS